MTHDVFLSCSSRDKPVGNATCAMLEARGIRCWIAPRDIPANTDWGNAIISAINASRLMVVVLSSSANISNHVKREVERAVNQGIPIVPIRIENVSPEGALEYFLDTTQWIDAFTPPIERHFVKLTEIVRQLLDGGSIGNLVPQSKSASVSSLRPRDATAENRTTEVPHVRADARSEPQISLPVFEPPTGSETANEKSPTTPPWLMAVYGLIAVGWLAAAVFGGVFLEKYLHQGQANAAEAGPQTAAVSAAAGHARQLIASRDADHGPVAGILSTEDAVETVQKRSRDAAAAARQIQTKANAVVEQARSAAQRAEAGAAEGYGVLNGEDKSGLTWKYEGQVSNGAADGFGVETWSDGKSFEGQFKGGSQDVVLGALHTTGGDYYGELKNGMFSGFGVIVLPDGAHYEGSIDAGERNGPGIFYLKDGTSLVANWLKGHQNGHSVLIDPGGHVLEEGLYKDDKLVSRQVSDMEKSARDAAAAARDAQAKASAVADQAIKAAQQAEAGGTDGYVVLTGNGPTQGLTWRYAGQVINGRANGLGVQTMSDGRRYEGEFKAGRPNGVFVAEYGDGHTFHYYYGSAKEGLCSGPGVAVFANGALFQGSFYGDDISGPGILYQKDGQTSIGSWERHELNGYAVKFDTLGHVVEAGLYRGDRLISPPKPR